MKFFIATAGFVLALLPALASVGAMPAPTQNILGQGATLGPCSFPTGQACSTSANCPTPQVCDSDDGEPLHCVNPPGCTSGGVPPFPTGDVGPNHYVQAVNTGYAIFDKSGNLLQAPRVLNALWSGYSCTNIGCNCVAGSGEPLVQYDQLADRWLISQVSFPNASSSGPSFLCVAVSKTPDPTGAYWRYDFQFPEAVADQFKVGVWPDGYYYSYNGFSNMGQWTGSAAVVLNRAAMLAGNPATMQRVSLNTILNDFGLLPSDLEGSSVPAAGTPNFYFGLGSNAIKVFQFHVDWTTPANTTFTNTTNLSTTAFTEACNGSISSCIVQPSPGPKLAPWSILLMYRAPYRVLGGHDAVVLNHTVAANSTSGIRWYEIRGLAAGAPTIFQQATYAPNDGVWRWMGSIAMDSSGNIALGFSASGTALMPEIRYAGRLTSDPSGMLGQGEATLFSGSGVDTGTDGGGWGPYTTISVDPSDDCTFWYTNEYYPSNGTYNWDTRIGAFRFPAPECGTTTTTTTLPTTTSTATSTTTTTLTGQTTTTVASTTTTTIAGQNPPFGGDDTGFLPPAGSALLKCENGVAKGIGKLMAALVKCHIARASGKTTADTFEDACESAAMAKFTAKTKTAGCTSCTDLNAIAQAITGVVDSNNGLAYCQ